MDYIGAAKNTEELSAIWSEMQQTGFLSWKVQPKDINDNATEFAALLIDDQKRFLIECLDKNLLYIPLSEINNSEFEVSEETKLLNSEFYG